jgi:hypothetical protein
MAAGASNCPRIGRGRRAVLFEVIGFMYRGLNVSRMTSELFWSGSTARWAILGALVGACIVYIRALLRS